MGNLELEEHTNQTKTKLITQNKENADTAVPKSIEMGKLIPQAILLVVAASSFDVYPQTDHLTTKKGN